jgi:hypothetical protein
MKQPKPRLGLLISTMPYSVRKDEDLKKISPGDQIAADVVVTDKAIYLQSVKVTGRAKEAR